MKRSATTRHRNLADYIATHRRRLLWLAGAVLLAAIVVGYVLWSVLSWRHLDTQAQTAGGAVERAVTTLVERKTTVATLSERTAALQSQIDTLCVVSPLVAWQAQLIAPATRANQACTQTQERLTSVYAALDALQRRLTSERDFAARLVAVQEQLAAVAADDYDAQRAIWAELHTHLQQSRVHGSLQSSKQAAVAATGELVAGYEQLVAAHAAEKRPEFDAAVAAIEKAYSKLGAIQNTSVESYDVLLTALAKTTAKLES